MSSRLHQLFLSPAHDRYILVLSGGGTRGFYTLWVLKAMEEAGLQDTIDAIYGISVWAIFGCYWAAGRRAQEIFDRFYSTEIVPKDWFKLLPTKSLLKNTVPQAMFKADLPKTFEELKIKTFIGATDLYSAALIMFDKWPLLEPLLGSMAIPGIFPSVAYQEYLLNDGGVIDNFPSSIAKKQYPHHRVIGVILNTLKELQTTPKNLIETLSLSFEILMRKDLVKKEKGLDIVFSEPITCRALDIDKKKRKKAFEQGYHSGMEKFKALSNT